MNNLNEFRTPRRTTGVRTAVRLTLATTSLAVMALIGVAQQSEQPGAMQKLPPNARTREATPEEMEKYDAEALAKTKGKASPVLRSPSAGPKGIQPEVFAILEKQRTFVASSAAHLSQPAMDSKASLQNHPSIGKGTVLSSGSSAPGNSAQPTTASQRRTDPTKQVQQASHVVYVCQSPLISDVNGQARNAVFTPQQEYNSYAIHGCFFGTQTGHAYLIGKFNAQKVDLETPFWNDTEIDARIDPNLSGEMDQDNVSLVVAPVGAAEMKASGFKFLAARSDPAVFLPSIPESWATITGAIAKSGALVPSHYFSPVTAGASVPQAAAGTSVYVERDFHEKFFIDRDFYDKFRLANGWALDSMQLFTYDSPPSCPGVVTYKEVFAVPRADWTGMHAQQAIQIVVPDMSCSGFIPIAPPFVFWTYSDRSGSAYALKIWARGPRCTDPYNGQPQHDCIQNMRLCGRETCSH